MTRRAVLVAAAVALVNAIVAASLYALRNETPAPAAVSPTPTATAAVAPSASPTVTPPPTTVTTPQPSPSPTAATGRYVNAAMLFSIELPAPWRRATCGPTSLGPLDGADFATDLFVPVPDRDLTLGDVGGLPVDQVIVSAQANPQALTPRQWKESGRSGGALGERVDDTTLGARPALLVTERDNERLLVATAGYMYTVGHQARGGNTTKAERSAIVRSLRFLSADEARAAASPKPAPRSPEVVADALAEGFAKKDTTILARVATRCLGEGGAQAGIGRKDTQVFLEAIRDRFARGLTVEAKARPLAIRAGEAPGYYYLKAVWREPGQPDRDSDLRIMLEGSTAYWDSVVYYPSGRP